MKQGEVAMNWELLMAGLVGVLLLVYLVYSLIYPERF
jgi:K+-transporting ATPase KdpF subunit